MSSNARAERRRAARARPAREGEGRALELVSTEEGYGVEVGWCLTEEDLPLLRRRTHDTVIASMGDRRTGGVQWRQYPAGPDAERALEALFDADALSDPHTSDVVRRLRGHLREWGGWIVVALAPGIMP